MKSLLLPFLAILFLISCGKESSSDLALEETISESNSENGSAANRGNKKDVCHDGNIINVNAIPAHQGKR
jgi:hypothetical protein